MTPTIVCWSEIPVSNLEKAVNFYSTVFKWTMKIDTTGPVPMADFGGTDAPGGGHLYAGKPAVDGSGPTVHMVVPDSLEDAIARCEGAGGKVTSDPIPLPMGRFVYASDPDGNAIGMFEPKAA